MPVWLSGARWPQWRTLRLVECATISPFIQLRKSPIFGLKTTLCGLRTAMNSQAFQNLNIPIYSSPKMEYHNVTFIFRSLYRNRPGHVQRFQQNKIYITGRGSHSCLAAVLSFADPEKRRKQQAAELGGDEKEVVRNHFNTADFDRWERIYEETTDVNSVQLDIREGHAQTVEKVLQMVKKDGSLNGISVYDAGCGTGSLSIPLALEAALRAAGWTVRRRVMTATKFYFSKLLEAVPAVS